MFVRRWTKILWWHLELTSTKAPDHKRLNTIWWVFLKVSLRNICSTISQNRAQFLGTRHSNFQLNFFQKSFQSLRKRKFGEKGYISSWPQSSQRYIPGVGVEDVIINEWINHLFIITVFIKINHEILLTVSTDYFLSVWIMIMKITISLISYQLMSNDNRLYSILF